MKFNAESLVELQAKHLPVMRACDLFSVKEDSEESRKLMSDADEYLKAFAKTGNECICCGSPLGAKDPINGFLTGATFIWGIVHGEGLCCKCGYPSRAHHFHEVVNARNLILQYHPDGLSFALTTEEPITTTSLVGQENKTRRPL